MTCGRELPPTSAFSDDDGAADAGLAAALARQRGGEGSVEEVVAALATARVLVPVLAEAGRTPVGEHGLPVDREASTGIVAVRSPDGRTALPVFSSTAAMAAWHRTARPVPAEGPRAAAAALQEGWEVLVVDPPVAPVVVPRPAVHALATGAPWVPAVRDGVVRAELGDAVTRAATAVPAVRAARAEPGRRAEVAVVLGVVPGLSRAGLGQVLHQVNARLAADGLVAGAVDSLELRVVAAG